MIHSPDLRIAYDPQVFFFYFVCVVIGRVGKWSFAAVECSPNNLAHTHTQNSSRRSKTKKKSNKYNDFVTNSYESMLNDLVFYPCHDHRVCKRFTIPSVTHKIPILCNVRRSTHTHTIKAYTLQRRPYTCTTKDDSECPRARHRPNGE